jgi:hypothetical protein
MSVFGLDHKNISYDASARMRVSQSTKLHDGKLLNADSSLMFDTKGTGTGAYSNNKYNMSVTSAQYLIRQTKRFSSYSSGTSQQIQVTFDGFAAEADVTKRVGYFSSIATGVYDSSYDGFWLENNGTTITLKCARAGTETLSVAITSWSGYANLAEYQNVANWGNFTVVEFDFLWLGGAVLRMYVKTSNGFVLAHIFNYSGTATDTFIKSPNQPLRYEIRSSTGTGSLRYICSQASTEGSIDEGGFNNGGHSLLTAGVPSQTVATIGTSYAVCGIRKKSTHRDNAVKVTNGDLIVQSGNDYIHYEVVLNPTLSTPLTYTSIANSCCEIGVAGAVTAISITATGGRALLGGFLVQGQPIPYGLLEKDFFSFLGCTIDNVMDEIVLVVTPLTANITLNGALNWKEY